MLWIILVTIFSAVVARPYIITPPNDVIGKLGGVAEFKCEVDEPTIPELTWEFNQDTIYSLQYGEEDYPMGTDKYSVEKNGRNFILKISNLQHSDGGRYTCRTLKQAEDAHLIVKEVAKSILTPPNDAIGKLGRTAQFKCVVEFEDIPVLTWEFNGNVIYSLQFYNEQYPMGRAKYSVKQDGRNFELTINDLLYEDGGKFACRVLAEVEEANLIVRDTQVIFSSTSNPVEGSTIEYICTVQFAGPSKNDISPEHFPQLRMAIDHEPLSGEFNEQELEGPTTFYKLMLTFNITLEAKMHGSTLLCEISATDPVLQVNVTNKVEVLYSVRRINYDPILTQYEVGSVITCLAEGNPQPLFMWDDRNNGSLKHGQTLTITKQMVGKNIWRCTANNTIKGHTHHERVVAVFEAVFRGEQEETEISTAGSRNDSWRIALPVAVVVCIAIFSHIAVIYCLVRHKKNKKLHSRYSIVPKESVETARNAELSRLIASLGHNYDLDYEIVKNMRQLLPDEVFPASTPSALVLFIYKSKYAMRSDYYHAFMQEMVTIYKKSQYDVKEDLLLPLVELLEEEPSMTQNHSKLTSLLEILVPLYSHAETRSKCMRALITKTKEWKDCNKEKVQDDINTLQWNHDLITILKQLLEGHADPAWSPATLSEGSILHTFMKVVVPVVISKPNLFESLLELLDMMMTQSAVVGTNVDSSKKTILHVLVSGVKEMSGLGRANELVGCANKFQELITRVKDKNLKLLDVTDISDCAPLHTFLNGIVPMKNLSQELLKHVTDIVLLLKSDTNVTNDLVNKDKQTALCIFTEFANVWVDHQEDFLKVVKCLKSDNNIAHKNGQGRTALEIFRKSGNVWTNNSNIFHEIFKCLIPPPTIYINNEDRKTIPDVFRFWADELGSFPQAFLTIVQTLSSEANKDIKDNEGETMLHIFASWFKKWEGQPELFLDIITNLKSDQNIDITNSRNNTALHRLASTAAEWIGNLQTLLKVTECLKSSKNIDIQNHKGKTALHLFIAKIADWEDQLDALIDVVNCIKSEKNLVLKDKLHNTPLHVFILSAGEWINQPDKSIKVVKCLKSKTNVDIKNEKGETALHLFIAKIAEWKDKLDALIDVVNCMKSEKNLVFKDKLGNTPLHVFILSAGEWKNQPDKFIKVVECLKHEANVDIKNEKGETALHLFISRGAEWEDLPKEYLMVVKNLTTSDNINVRNDDGATPLHLFTSMAGEWRYYVENIIEVLSYLKSSINTDIETSFGETPLHIFISKAGEWKDHRQEFLKVLSNLISDTNRDIRNVLFESPLHVFTSKAREWRDYPEAFLKGIECLTSDTNINMKNIRGATALHNFTSYVDVWKYHPGGFKDVVKYLTDRSQKVISLKDKNIINIQDQDGDTALHYLFLSFINWEDNHNVFSDIAKSYAEQWNVNVKIRGNKGQLTCSLKAEKDIPEALLDFFTKFSTNTKISKKKHGERILQIFTSSRGKWAEHPLCFLEVVQCLASPENIDIPNRNKDTVLHWFARCKSEWADHSKLSEVVQCLMSHENIKVRNTDGHTALDLFRENWGESAEPVIQVAIDKFGYVTEQET